MPQDRTSTVTDARWRDTAAGRTNHYETCTAVDHRDCGRTLVPLRWRGAELVGDILPGGAA
ncbi:hypothetical protein ACFFX1_54620 [Dactylosporangium sucinum]